MGGRHTMFVGFNALDLFASFGVLSAGDVEAEKSLAAFLNTPDLDRKIEYLFVGQGTVEAEGRFGARVAALVAALEAHGIRHEYYVGGHGGHDWATWRHLLYARFLPNLFRGQASPRPAPVRTESGLVQGVAVRPAEALSDTRPIYLARKGVMLWSRPCSRSPSS
jgi:hypothetical protein